jgi:hypothetical protein
MGDGVKIYLTSDSCTDEAEILKPSHCRVRRAGEDYENHWIRKDRLRTNHLKKWGPGNWNDLT